MRRHRRTLWTNMNSRGKYVTSCPYGAEVQSLRANRSELTQSARGFLFILDKYGSEECHISIYIVLYISSLSVSCSIFHIVWLWETIDILYILCIPQIMTKWQVFCISNLFLLSILILCILANLIQSKTFSHHSRFRLFLFMRLNAAFPSDASFSCGAVFQKSLLLWRQGDICVFSNSSRTVLKQEDHRSNGWHLKTGC